MLKKLAVIMAVFAFSFSACKKEDASREEARAKTATLMEESVSKMVNAEDADAFAAALNEFIDAKEQRWAEKKAKKGAKDKDCAAKKDKDCAGKKDGDCEFKKDCDFKEQIDSQIEKFKDNPEVQKALERLEQKCAEKKDCIDKKDCKK